MWFKSHPRYDTFSRNTERIEDEINKAQAGNKAAGTRVRKQMQQIKQVAQEIRKGIVELRKTD